MPSVTRTFVQPWTRIYHYGVNVPPTLEQWRLFPRIARRLPPVLAVYVPRLSVGRHWNTLMGGSLYGLYVRTTHCQLPPRPQGTYRAVLTVVVEWLGSRNALPPVQYDDLRSPFAWPAANKTVLREWQGWRGLPDYATLVFDAAAAMRLPALPSVAGYTYWTAELWSVIYYY